MWNLSLHGVKWQESGRGKGIHEKGTEWDRETHQHQCGGGGRSMGCRMEGAASTGRLSGDSSPFCVLDEGSIQFPPTKKGQTSPKEL